MKKSILAAFIASTLVIGGGSVAMAASNTHGVKTTCAAAKASHKAAVTKAEKKATAKVVAKVCKAKK